MGSLRAEVGVPDGARLLSEPMRLTAGSAVAADPPLAPAPPTAAVVPRGVAGALVKLVATLSLNGGATGENPSCCRTGAVTGPGAAATWAKGELVAGRPRAVATGVDAALTPRSSPRLDKLPDDPGALLRNRAAASRLNGVLAIGGAGEAGTESGRGLDPRAWANRSGAEAEERGVTAAAVRSCASVLL